MIFNIDKILCRLRVMVFYNFYFFSLVYTTVFYFIYFNPSDSSTFYFFYFVFFFGKIETTIYWFSLYFQQFIFYLPFWTYIFSFGYTDIVENCIHWNSNRSNQTNHNIYDCLHPRFRFIKLKIFKYLLFNVQNKHERWRIKIII